MHKPEYDFTLEMWYLKIDILKHTFYGYFDSEEEANIFNKKMNNKEQ